MRKKCKVCGNEFFKDPLLRCDIMPRATQFLPDREMLKSDKGVAQEVYLCSGCGLGQLSNDHFLSNNLEKLKSCSI